MIDISTSQIFIKVYNKPKNILKLRYFQKKNDKIRRVKYIIKEVK
jgi:hypothetical protein